MDYVFFYVQNGIMMFLLAIQMSSFFFDFHYAMSWYFPKSIHSKFKVFIFSYSGQFWAQCYFIGDIKKEAGNSKARSDYVTNTKLISTYEWTPKEDLIQSFSAM